MNQRERFALESIQEGANLKALCQKYGISRPTGYLWKQRYLAEGGQGLYDRSRRPKRSVNELPESVICEIVRLKNAHRHWGPYKIHQCYLRIHGQGPSASSFKRVLDAAGLVKKRKRRDSRKAGRIHYGVQAQGPNDIWTVDFKGWWYVSDGSRCEPLTVRDEFTRYLLEVRALEGARCETVKACFEQLFVHYGLPKIIRSDNGPPFASSNAVMGLSRLSAWWMSLGISLERGRPGKPQDNGAHERLHRDIRQELQSHAKGNIRQQQAAFELWKETFNQQRPHEALGMKVPAQLYEKSTIKYDRTKSDLSYQDMLTRRVTTSGTIRIHGIRFALSTALVGYSIGLKPMGSDCLAVYFADLFIGTIDLSTHAFHRAASGPMEAQKQPA